MCPVVPYLDLSSNYSELQNAFHDVLMGEDATPDALNKAFSCAECADCLSACPMGLNPYFMQVLFRIAMIANGQSPVGRQVSAKNHHPSPDPLELICHLQVGHADIRWLNRMPDNPSQTDLVVFLGCNVRMFPEQILASMAVLDKIGLDYVALAGGSLCCGSKYLEQNDIQKASQAADALIAALSAFKPKTVAFWCGTCAWLLRDVYPRFAEISFQVRHLAQLLCEYLNELDFSIPVVKNLTVHDACNLGRKVGDVDSIRSLMGALPGANIVEMTHNRKKALCCGGNAYAYFPDVAVRMKQARLEEARQTGADVMTYACHGCHHMFSMEEERYPFTVRSYISLLAAALGFNHEDKMKTYLKLKDVDRVMETIAEHIEKSDFSEEEIRHALSICMNKAYYLET